MIGIIDYGMGNLRSVQKALERLGADARIVRDPDHLGGLEGAILPGVGAFRDAIGELRRLDFVSALETYVHTGRPLLGICLGLQLLFERSFEDGVHEGLGFIAGEVVRFQPEPGLKIPHMGWNALEIISSNPLLAGIDSGDYVYFVHSYYAQPADSAVIAARTRHGEQTLASIVAHDNLYATQFHPEKSQRVGLQILENFINLVTAPAAR
jgi:glutamine amidotransferase